MSTDYQALLAQAVASRKFPCVGAQKAMKEKAVGYYEASHPFGTAAAARETLTALSEWAAAEYPKAKEGGPLHFVSFTATYPNPGAGFPKTEDDAVLWRFLAEIHAFDREAYPWDPQYARFVYDPRFEMSIAGHGHFTVLMGPQATTASRWFPVPAIVFNPSFMFEKLRASGMYGRWRDAIRGRERTLQRGWINPKLSDFGEALAAPQYALTLAPVFDIGDCPFTGAPRPPGLALYDMDGYPFAPGEVETLFWNAIKADV